MDVHYRFVEQYWYLGDFHMTAASKDQQNSFHSFRSDLKAEYGLLVLEFPLRSATTMLETKKLPSSLAIGALYSSPDLLNIGTSASFTQLITHATAVKVTDGDFLELS